MTTEADRIAARELDHIAWAICDMLHTAARDDRPSAAAQSLLAIVRNRAPRRLQIIIETRGFAAFTTHAPERAALSENLRSTAEELARRILGHLAAPQPVGIGGRGRERPFEVTGLAKIGRALSKGLKTRLQAL